MAEKTDYTKFDGADLLYALNDNAQKWAEAFLQYNPDANVSEDTLTAWFANAIEHSHDIRVGNILNGEHAQYLLDKGLDRHGQPVR